MKFLSAHLYILLLEATLNLNFLFVSLGRKKDIAANNFLSLFLSLPPSSPSFLLFSFCFLLLFFPNVNFRSRWEGRLLTPLSVLHGSLLVPLLLYWWSSGSKWIVTLFQSHFLGGFVAGGLVFKARSYQMSFDIMGIVSWNFDFIGS